MLIPDLLRAQAQSIADRTAVVVDGEGSMTYGQWELRSNRLARALVDRGIRPGERVGILQGNREGLAFVSSYMAIHKAGAVSVPLNTRLSPRELSYIVDHSGAAAVLHDADRADTAGALAGPRITLGTDELAEICACGDGSEYQVARTDEDLADILYTSGTTGFPKGVACSHGNVTFKANTNLEALFSGATFLHAIPLFTFAGTHAMTLIPLRSGMTSVIQPRFDAARFVELLAEHGVRMTFAVPSMILLMLREPRIREGGFALQMLLYGTAPMPEWAIRQLVEVFPRTMLVNMYGLTESGGAVCSLPPSEAQKRPGSIGKPVPPAQMRVVDDDGADLPAGQPGEILMRAPTRPRSYFKDEQATRNTWTDDGWLRTGDIGHLDEDGYLYLVDRKKDLIIRGGHNIAAAEIEAVLAEHAGVREAAVIGVPHEVLGEDTKAFVVLDAPGAADAAQLEAYCRDRLADFKVPRQYEFLSALPRNALGKVLKRTLRGGDSSGGGIT